MSNLSGQLEGRSIVEVIRQVYLARRTGTLAIEHDHSLRKFHFLEGELHLPGGHALARRLSNLVEFRRRLLAERGREGSPSVNPELRAQAAEQLDHLVGRIVDVLVEWRTGCYRFNEDLSSLPVDLVGPLPTATLIMEGSARGLPAEALLERLGGERASVVSNPDSTLLGDPLSLKPGEMFLLSRAESPVSIGELVHQMPGSRTATLQQLCRLQSVDLIGRPGNRPKRPHVADGQEVDRLVERFLGRIGKLLDERPIDMAVEAHRARVAQLLAAVGSLTYYELLEVEPHEDETSIHRAYEDIARLVHPCHAEPLGFQGREGALRLLFERATLAYVTLTDPERRAQYHHEAGIEASITQSPDERSDESRQLARTNHARALELIEQQDYHFALELIRQALRIDPRGEYFATQGRIQAQNRHWLGHATESYRQAIRRDPDNVDYRVALAELFEQRGDLQLALAQFRTALQLDPHHIEANAGLDRLRKLGPRRPRPASQAAAATSSPTVGLIGRLKRILVP